MNDRQARAAQYELNVTSHKLKRPIISFQQHTVWRVIFVESRKWPSKLIFMILNFMTSKDRRK